METVRELVEAHGEVNMALVGMDGNAFMIMGSLSKAMSRAMWPKEARDQVLAEMQSGDYDNLLQVARIVCGDSAWGEDE